MRTDGGQVQLEAEHARQTALALMAVDSQKLSLDKTGERSSATDSQPSVAVDDEEVRQVCTPTLSDELRLEAADEGGQWRTFPEGKE